MERKFFEVKLDVSTVKVLSTALHLLQKIGKDAIIEVEEDMMTLRALNDNRSAFAAIEFERNFFDSFLLVQRDQPFACKLAVKPLCVILRNVKNVNNLVMTACQFGADHELAFHFHLNNGITRCFRFNYMDCEIMNAIFHEMNCSFLNIRSKFMAQILQHFHRSPEIAITATEQNFGIRSFHAPEVLLRDAKNIMNTGLSVNPQEFETYDFRSEYTNEELIFGVKEITAFCGFCEALELNTFHFFFTTGGSAIKFSTKQDFITASIIMATIEQITTRVLREDTTLSQQTASSIGEQSKAREHALTEINNRVKEYHRGRQHTREEREQFLDLTPPEGDGGAEESKSSHPSPLRRTDEADEMRTDEENEENSHKPITTRRQTTKRTSRFDEDEETEDEGDEDVEEVYEEATKLGERRKAKAIEAGTRSREEDHNGDDDDDAPTEDELRIPATSTSTATDLPLTRGPVVNRKKRFFEDSSDDDEAL